MNDSDGSFAFVAGVPDDVTVGRTQTGDELEVVLQGISVLMNWRLARSIAATVFAMTWQDLREYELEVRPRELSYVLKDKVSGVIDEYHWPSTTQISSGEPVVIGPGTIAFEPLPVRLAFPQSLSIWGRSTDSWRICSGRREPGEIILGLRHRKDVHLDGTLTIDLDLGMAVRLDTPMESYHYENVEPLYDQGA